MEGIKHNYTNKAVERVMKFAPHGGAPGASRRETYLY